MDYIKLFLAVYLAGMAVIMSVIMAFALYALKEMWETKNAVN